MGEVIKVEKNGKFLGWYVRYVDSDGKRKKRASKQPSKALAQVFLAEIEGRIRRGQAGLIEPSADEQKRKTVTVAELAARFVEEYSRPRLRDRERYMEQVRATINQRLLPYPIAQMAAASVRKADVIAFRDALRAAGYRNATINESLHRLSHFYNWAIDLEYVDCKNPASQVEYMPAPPSEERYSLEHVHRLLAPEHRHPMVATALYTGMRKGELFGLTWACVRFDLGCIEVKRSFKGPPKNGKPRTVPMHPELVPILREWQAACPETADRLVFPVRKNGRYRMPSQHDMEQVRAILETADCPHNLDRPWHAMRHTFATLFAESQGARDALEQILGHSASGNRITAGYTHLSFEYLAREMAKLTLRPAAPAKVLRLDAYRQQPTR